MKSLFYNKCQPSQKKNILHHEYQSEYRKNDSKSLLLKMKGYTNVYTSISNEVVKLR